MIKKLFSLFSVTVLLSQSLLAQSQRELDLVNSKMKIKNEMYYKIDGSKLRLIFPYNYLDDKHPAKLDAVKFVNKMQLSLLKSWANFYLQSSGNKDEHLKQIVEDKSPESYQKLQEYISNNNLRHIPPSELIERARERVAASESSTLQPNKGTDNAILTELQEIADVNKARKLMEANIADFRKEFEEAYSGWLEKEDETYKKKFFNTFLPSRYPDYFLVQGAFNLPGMNDSLTAYAEGVNHPLVRSVLSFVAKFPLSALRFTLTTRPWVVRSYDLNTATTKEEYVFEQSIHLWVNKGIYEIGADRKAGKFFRIGVGGINGIYSALDEIEGLALSGSVDINGKAIGLPNLSLNAKSGVITPLLKSWSELYASGNPYSGFYMLSLQKGSLVEQAKAGIKFDSSYIISMPRLTARLGLDYSGLNEDILKALQDRRGNTIRPWPGTGNGGTNPPPWPYNPPPGTNNPRIPTLPINGGGNSTPTIPAPGPVITFPGNVPSFPSGNPRRILLEGIEQSYQYMEPQVLETSTEEKKD